MTFTRNTIKKYLPPFLILITGAGVIFFNYLQIPKNTTFDEIEFAKLALQLDKQPYTPYSPYATGHATLYFYILLTSFKLLGPGLLALRLPAALFGLVNPVIFYLIMRRIFKNQILIPLIAALILATMRWYFNFARFGFEVTFLLMLELLSLLFALMFRDRNKASYLVLSGIFAGLAFNSYQPGRVFAIIPLFVILTDILKDMPIPKKIASQIPSVKRMQTYVQQLLQPLSRFLIPFFILIAPLTIYLNIHKDTRFYQQFYPDNHEMTIGEKGEFFLRNLSSTSGIFTVRGDVNGRHNYPNKPALNPVLSVLFITGLVLSLLKIKHRQNQLFIIWFLLSLAPTLVTYPWENPNMLRTFTVLPSVVYFVTLALDQLFSMANRKQLYKPVIAVAVIALLGSGLYETRTYFIHQAQVFREAFETSRDLKEYLK